MIRICIRTCYLLWSFVLLVLDHVVYTIAVFIIHCNSSSSFFLNEKEHVYYVGPIENTFSICSDLLIERQLKKKSQAKTSVR